MTRALQLIDNRLYILETNKARNQHFVLYLFKVESEIKTNLSA